MMFYASHLMSKSFRMLVVCLILDDNELKV